MSRRKRLLALALLAAAVCLIAAGLTQGGYADVLEKARMICFECIGLA